jgi:hypothetical protein
VNGLLALTRDPGVADWVRRAAAYALGGLGRPEQATQILLGLTRDPRVLDLVGRGAYVSLKQLMGVGVE